MNNMATQDNIAEIYEVLAPMAGDYMNAQAEQIGQAQRSMGPMAAAVQGSTTSGLGNYTYNRLMRPQVDVMRDEIRTQGYANQLNRLLSDALNNARNRYNRRGSGNKSGGTTANPDTSGVTTIGGSGTKSTGAGDSGWAVAYNSFQWEDKNGNWHTVKRSDYGDTYTDTDWMNVYFNAKNSAKQEGRGFRDGSGE